MNLLLDTHVLLWVLSEPEKLLKKAAKEIDSPKNLVYVSFSA